MNTGVGSIMTAKIGEVDNIIREVRKTGIIKEVVGCFQSISGKKSS